MLFGVWLEDVEEIEFSSVRCKVCGFVGFLPRPTKEDIDRKYLFLNEHSIAKGEGSTEFAGDKARSGELYNHVKDYIGEGSLKFWILAVETVDYSRDL